jgi:hypothetical protein
MRWADQNKTLQQKAFSTAITIGHAIYSLLAEEDREILAEIEGEDAEEISSRTLRKGTLTTGGTRRTERTPQFQRRIGHILAPKKSRAFPLTST